MSKLIIPEPAKSSRKDRVIHYAFLYILHLADLYMCSCPTGKSKDLKFFLGWIDKMFWEKDKELETKKGFNFLNPFESARAKETKRMDLIGIAKFLYSSVRIYWDEVEEGKRNDLSFFTTQWLPHYKNKLCQGTLITTPKAWKRGKQ